MCIPGINPMMLAGIAANVAGAAINARIQNQAIAEQNKQNQIAMDREHKAREAESKRQLEMEVAQADRARAAAAEAEGGQIAEKVEAVAEDPANEYVAIADEYNVPMLQGQTNDGQVSESIGKIVGDALRNTREILKNQSMLVGQNTAFSGIGDEIMRMSSDISNVGSNRRGSLGVSRLETTVPAATVTKSSSPIGDLLMMGGKALAGYGGKVGGMPTASVATASPGSIFNAPLVPQGYTPLPVLY